jgi:hypothetical protein
MADYEHQNMWGSIFKNKYKKLDKHPDYSGDAKINDVDHKIALWIKVDKNGNKYFSCKIQKADDVRFNGGQRQAAAAIDIDDDIPF